MKRHGAAKILSAILSIMMVFLIIPTANASAYTSADRYYYLQWALKNNSSFSPTSGGGSSPAVAGIDIDMEKAWDSYGTSGRPVVVAIIDTGVDYANSDLSDHVWTNTDEIPGNGIDDDNNGYVDDVHGWNFRDGSNVLHTTGQDNHGTHCYSTIGASVNADGVAGICGLTPNVKVMILKAFDGATATGNTDDIVKAIKYAEANGASIVNMSLGVSEYNYPLYRAIKSSGMLFVAAAGNNGQNCDSVPVYPAAFDLDNIISVANLSYNGELDSTSNYGPKTVDLAAPGTAILGYGAQSKFYYMTGTSMAAPMVTGTAALVYSHFSTLSLAGVEDVILKTVKPLTALSGKTLTGGMLDAGAALSYALSASFKDVNSGDWFYTYVTKLASKGIVSGYSDGTFRPQGNVTVGEALKLVMLASGYSVQSPTGSHWASGYRDLAVKDGIVSAGDVTSLDVAADRLFIAQTAAKALKLSSVSSASPFADANDGYLTALYNAGIVEGTVDSSGKRMYKPDSNISRGEICAIITRITDK